MSAIDEMYSPWEECFGEETCQCVGEPCTCNHPPSYHEECHSGIYHCHYWVGLTEEY